MYSRAEDLFEAARCAGIERMRALRQMESMRARAGISGAPIVGSRGGSGDMNRVGDTIELLDYEARMRSRIESDERLLGYATSVLYGKEGSGGVASLLSSRHADALFWRYLANEPWKVCAAYLDESERTLRRMCMEAFDMVDMLGFDSVIAGRGMAED